MISPNYQFPKITEEMYNKLNDWVEKNRLDKTNSVIGGNLTFEITPTSVGDVIKVRSYDYVYDELGNISHDSKGKAYRKEISLSLSSI